VAKSPAFQFYANDFLGGRVATYSLEEIGLYSVLLAFDWSLNGLPTDAEKLAKLSRTSTRKFRSLWAVVGENFTERDGRMYNPRLELERQKQEQWREKSAKGGRASATKRGSTTLDECLQPNGNTQSSSPTSVTEEQTTARAVSVIRRLPNASPDVLAVLTHYKSVHAGRRPGPKDEKAIAKALGFGFSAPELCEAIDGNAADDWHAQKRKHDLPYVLRDTGTIDNFRAKPRTVTVVSDGWYSDVAV